MLLSYLSYEKDFLTTDTWLAILCFVVPFWLGLLIVEMPVRYRTIISEINYKNGCFVLLIFLNASVTLGCFSYFNAADSSCSSDPSALACVRRVLATGAAEPPVWAIFALQLRPAIQLGLLVSILYHGSFLLKVLLFLVSLSANVAYSVAFLNRDSLVFFCYLLVFVLFFVNSGDFGLVKRRASLSVRKLYYSIAVSVLGLFLFTAISFYRGNSVSFFTEASSYLAGSLSGLNAYIDGYSGAVVTLEPRQVSQLSAVGYVWDFDIAAHKVFGFLTRILDRLGVVNYYVALHGEYIFAPLPTNIYTAVRDVISVSGFKLLAPFSFLFGCLAGFCFRLCSRFRTPFSIFLAASVSYSCLRWFGGIWFVVKEVFVFWLLFATSDKLFRERASKPSYI